MMEKEYVVCLNRGVDYDQFWQDMESITNGLITIPDRIVDIVNERPGSLRSCHYSLTELEASMLRADPRVYCVEIPPNQRSDIEITHDARQDSDFTKTSNISGNFVNWGLRRCMSAVNPYGIDTVASGPYTYNLDGSGVDMVISDSGLQIDHPEFVDAQGVSRVVQLNWYTASGLPGTQSANFYRDLDGHGTHCGGIAAGLTYGWAKNSKIYVMKVNGLEGAGDENTGLPISDVFDTIKLWHQSKPIDQKTGARRPTVVNMSWGYVGSFTNITGGVYRGTSWVGTGKNSTYGMVGDSNNRFQVRVSSVDVDLDELIAAGVVCVTSAGNSFQKIDVSGGTDYDNYFISSTAGNRYYHRGGSPFSDDAIKVGSTDRTLLVANLERKSGFSNAGPGITIYAPGSNIMSAVSTVNKFSSASYYRDPAFRQTNISGTSMASPQVAGVAALYLQINPHATPAQVQQWLISQSTAVLSSTGLDDDYTNQRSILGGANRHMYNPFNSDASVSYNGAVRLNNISMPA